MKIKLEVIVNEDGSVTTGPVPCPDPNKWYRLTYEADGVYVEYEDDEGKLK